MNKLVKGSIAGAAGIALLLGGAGTLASWNDSATLAGAGAISSGTLNVVDDATAGVWTVAHNGGAATAVTDIATFRVVPGDVLTYENTLGVTAVGDNLAFTVGSNIGAITSGFTSGDVVVTPTFTVTDGTTTITPGTGGVYTAASGVTTVVAKVVVAFNWGTAGSSNADKAKSLDLSTAVINVTQVTKP